MFDADLDRNDKGDGVQLAPGEEGEEGAEGAEGEGAGRATRRSLESVKYGERLMEALDMADHEKVRNNRFSLGFGTSLSYATSSETSMVKSYLKKTSQWGVRFYFP